MSWEAIAGFAVAFFSFVGVNLGGVWWLIDRSDRKKREADEKVESLRKDFTNHLIKLPLEYVRREDWIRFGSTIDAKLDAMRAEMREELSEIKAKYA